MTWSSSNPRRVGAGARAAAPAEWSWAELEPGDRPPEAEEQLEQSREERHREEVEEAYRRGLQEGKAAARAQARGELASAMSVARQAAEEVRQSRASWTATLQENLVALAAAIARQIIERELSLDPSIFADTARRAVAAFPADEPLRIRLHPDDLHVLETSEVLSTRDVVQDRTVRWVPDEDMVRGGCVVEGPDKIVDGRVDEALIRTVRTLTHG